MAIKSGSDRRNTHLKSERDRLSRSGDLKDTIPSTPPLYAFTGHLLYRKIKNSFLVRSGPNRASLADSKVSWYSLMLPATAPMAVTILGAWNEPVSGGKRRSKSPEGGFLALGQQISSKVGETGATAPGPAP